MPGSGQGMFWRAIYSCTTSHRLAPAAAKLPQRKNRDLALEKLQVRRLAQSDDLADLAVEAMRESPEGYQTLRGFRRLSGELRIKDLNTVRDVSPGYTLIAVEGAA